jgi:trimeric autotransporter adhesin
VPVPPGQEYCSSDFGCPISDRNAKHDIVPVDTDRVLERVVRMSINEWSYNDIDPSARHIGPMAQDFHDAFGTGTSDKCIPTVDANGVALAAIQALYRRVEHIDEETRALRQENAELHREIDRLRAR